MTPGALAQRIKSRLVALGLTQQAVAQGIGMDPTALSKILSGRRQISSLELALLARALDISVAELLTDEDTAPTDARIAARTQAETAPAVSQALARVTDFLDIDRLLVDLGLSSTSSPLPLPLSPANPIDQGKELAKKVREIADHGDEDIEELASFCEQRLSVDVSVEPLPPGLDGLSVARGGYRLVLISSSIPATRQRYTLAHELGHLAAGDDNSGITIDESLFGVKNAAETRANSFASAFLMPPSSLRRALGSAGPTESTIGAMLARYKVSIDALAFSLHNANLVDAQGRDRIRAMSPRKFALLAGHQDEYHRQLQEHATRRLPTGLLARAVDAFRSGQVGVSVLARLTRIAENVLLEHVRPLPPVTEAQAQDPDRELVL